MLAVSAVWHLLVVCRLCLRRAEVWLPLSRVLKDCRLMQACRIWVSVSARVVSMMVALLRYA